MGPSWSAQTQRGRGSIAQAGGAAEGSVALLSAEPPILPPATRMCLCRYCSGPGRRGDPVGSDGIETARSPTRGNLRVEALLSALSSSAAGQESGVDRGQEWGLDSSSRMIWWISGGDSTGSSE